MPVRISCRRDSGGCRLPMGRGWNQGRGPRVNRPSSAGSQADPSALRFQPGGESPTIPGTRQRPEGNPAKRGFRRSGTLQPSGWPLPNRLIGRIPNLRKQSGGASRSWNPGCWNLPLRSPNWLANCFIP